MISPTVLLTDNDLGDRELEANWLREALGAEVVIANCRTDADVVDAITTHQPDAIVTQWAPISSAAIAVARGRCQVISRIGIGTDMIDEAAAAAAGIAVKNVPDYCLEEVATHAVTLALTLWRRIPHLHGEVLAGMWNAAAHAPHVDRLSQATIGLIGCGRIGGLVASAFAQWGTSVVVMDPAPHRDPYERVSLQELCARSDIISVHAPLNEATRHLIDADALARMVRQPVLVNTSRGAIVDTIAAAEAVNRGQLRGLGLDVFEVEPLPIDHPLRTSMNTVLTPHAAWCSRDGLHDLRRGAIDNVVSTLSASGPGRNV